MAGFSKRNLLNIKCVLIVSKQTLAEIFIILRIIHRYTCHILMKLEFSCQIFENAQAYFMKIDPVGTEFFNADRRTDMAKLIVAFRISANVPKNTLRCPS